MNNRQDPALILLFAVPLLGAAMSAKADVTPPAPMPTYHVGDEFTYEDNGKQSHSVVTAVDGDLVHYKEPATGSRWSYFRNFALPTPKWGGGETNRQFFVGDIGSFFPLKIGNTMEFSVHGADTGSAEGWDYNTRCEVTGKETIKVKAGEFSTYRVDCVSNQWGWEKTYYYAPGPELLVRQVTRTEGQPETVQDLVAYERTR